MKGDQKLENFILQRGLQPPPKASSWERETGRGLVYNFGEYHLSMTNREGGEENVIINEDSAMIATRVWDCSAVTAKWIERHSTTGGKQPDISNALQLKTPSTRDHTVQVLELGAGTGLLSVCLAKLGAAVMSTEYGAAVGYLSRNCARNCVLHDPESTGCTLKAGATNCRELDWYKDSETLESMFLPGELAIFDLIIVTDCSLSERDTRGVFHMIEKYATKGHTRVVTGACKEREGTPLFLSLARENFTNVAEIPSSEHHSGYRTNRHVILTFDA